MLNQRYILDEKLGEGGMGVVHRATDRLTGDVVALKQITIPAEHLLFMSHSLSMTTRERRLALAREFQTVASLRHPHIISVLDYGFDEEQPYFTMTYLRDGQTILQAGLGQPLERRVELLQQLLLALAYLHRRGILHRDLKPENVLVSGQTVRVLDFGLAAIRGEEKFFSGGTLAYLAPEVWEEEPFTKAADLYAVGVMAYELLAGCQPFDPTSDFFIDEVLDEGPDLTRLNVDDDLAAVISNLLAKKPSERFPTAEACINAFSQAIAAPAPKESVAIRESFLQAAQFVGREAELQALQEASKQARAGQGSACLVGGESGVGKSRLLNELRIQALVDGMLVIRGQSVRDGRLSYELWREPLRYLVLATNPDEFVAGILRQIVPDIETLLQRKIPAVLPLDGQAGQQRLLSAITALFRQQQRPILLMLEDLQWVGEGLPILKQLNRMVADLPLLIVGSYRNDEMPHLPEQLSSMKHITLSRFSPTEMAALSVSMLGIAGQQANILALLQKETEGNVFFLVEVVRALAEEAGRLANIEQMTLPISVFPDGIQTIVRRRLARVPADAHPLLLLAATAGRQLDLKLLAQLATQLGTEMDLEVWLTTCAHAAVLEVHQEGWHFAHDKLRDGLLQQLAPERLAAQHHQVAQAIEQTYPNHPDHAATLAYHWQQVGNRNKERYYAQRAGQHAYQEFANDKAIRYFSRAFELTPPTALSQRYDLLVAREKVVDLQGQRQAQQQDLTALSRLAERLAEPQKQVFVALRKANYALVTSDHAMAITAAQRAINFAPHKSEAAAGYLLWGHALMRQGEYQAAQSQLEQALTFASPLSQTEADTYRILGLVFTDQGHYAQAIKHCEEALAIYQKLDNPRGISVVLNNLANIFHAQGDYAKAKEHWEKALQIHQKIGDRQSTGMVLNNLGTLYMDVGDYAKAQRYNETVLHLCREIDSGLGQCFALLNLGLLFHYQNEAEVAYNYSQQAFAMAQQIGSVRLQAYGLTNLGHTLAELARLEEASAAYQQVIALWEKLGQSSYTVDARAGLARIALAQEDWHAAQGEVEQILSDLAQNKNLDGIEEPFQVYLTCYHVLALTNHSRAQPILQIAHNLLQTRAAKIINEDMRRSFIQNVPSHREIIAEWMALS